MSVKQRKCCDFCNKQMTSLENETKGGEDICDSCMIIYRDARNEAWEEMGDKYPIAVKYCMMMSEVLTSKFDEEKIVSIIGQQGTDVLKAIKNADLKLLKGIDDGTIVYEPEPEPEPESEDEQCEK